MPKNHDWSRPLSYRLIPEITFVMVNRTQHNQPPMPGNTSESVAQCRKCVTDTAVTAAILLQSQTNPERLADGSVGQSSSVIGFATGVIRECNLSGLFWHFLCCICVYAKLVDNYLTSAELSLRQENNLTVCWLITVLCSSRGDPSRLTESFKPERPLLMSYAAEADGVENQAEACITDGKSV